MLYILVLISATRQQHKIQRMNELSLFVPVISKSQVHRGMQIFKEHI